MTVSYISDTLEHKIETFVGFPARVIQHHIQALAGEPMTSDNKDLIKEVTIDLFNERMTEQVCQ